MNRVTGSLIAMAVSLASAVLVSGMIPPALGAEPAGYRVYVTNERSGSLSVIDGPTRKVVATLQLGKRPRGLKLSGDGKSLLVAMSGSPIAGPGVEEDKLPPPDKSADGIGVVDLATLKLTRVIRGVSDPEQLAVSRDGTHLFIASEDTGTAIIIDARDGHTVASLKVGGEPEGMTTSPDGKVVYVTSEADHRVSVIDVATSKVISQMEVGQRPRFTAFSEDGKRAYVSCENDNSISVIDTAEHKVLKTIKLEGGPLMRPVGLIVSRDGSRLYAATGRGGLVVAIDIESGKSLGSVPVGPRPWGIALSPDGKTIFTANGSSNDVSVVDVATLKLETKLAVGDGPWGAVVALWPPAKH